MDKLLIIKALRLFIFGLFVICNAIIASVAVWNLSIVQSLQPISSTLVGLDAFIIFVGCSGLALILPVAFSELSGWNNILVRVWFECAWVFVFMVLELASAITLTAVSKNRLCVSAPIRTLKDADTVHSRCSSGQVLQAFTWTTGIMLFSYFCYLLTSAILHRRHDSRVWHNPVRRFPGLDTRYHITSAPATPIQPMFSKEPPVFAAPKPRRTGPIHNAIYAYRSRGMSMEYEIEPYQPPSPPAPVAFPPAMHSMQYQNNHRPTIPAQPTSLYPQLVQTSLQSQPQRTSRQAPAQSGNVLSTSPSPPPLGDWPRKDALSRPPRSKRKVVPPTLEIHTNNPPATSQFETEGTSESALGLYAHPE